MTVVGEGFSFQRFVSRLRSPVHTEGGDAPGAQGARRAHTGATDEQRRAPGCSAGRMYQDLGDATLALKTPHTNVSCIC